MFWPCVRRYGVLRLTKAGEHLAARPAIPFDVTQLEADGSVLKPGYVIGRVKLNDLGNRRAGLLPLASACVVNGASNPELCVLWPQLNDAVKNLIPLGQFTPNP